MLYGNWNNLLILICSADYSSLPDTESNSIKKSFKKIGFYPADCTIFTKWMPIEISSKLINSLLELCSCSDRKTALTEGSRASVVVTTIKVDGFAALS